MVPLTNTDSNNTKPLPVNPSSSSSHVPASANTTLTMVMSNSLLGNQNQHAESRAAGKRPRTDYKIYKFSDIHIDTTTPPLFKEGEIQKNELGIQISYGNFGIPLRWIVQSRIKYDFNRLREKHGSPGDGHQYFVINFQEESSSIRTCYFRSDDTLYEFLSCFLSGKDTNACIRYIQAVSKRPDLPLRPDLSDIASSSSKEGSASSFKRQQINTITTTAQAAFPNALQAPSQSKVASTSFQGSSSSSDSLQLIIAEKMIRAVRAAALPGGTHHSIEQALVAVYGNDNSLKRFAIAALAAVKPGSTVQSIYLELLRHTPPRRDLTALAYGAIIAASSPTATSKFVLKEVDKQLSDINNPLKPFSLINGPAIPPTNHEIIYAAVKAVQWLGPEDECVELIIKSLRATDDKLAEIFIEAAKLAVAPGAAFESLAEFFKHKGRVRYMEYAAAVMTALTHTATIASIKTSSGYIKGAEMMITAVRAAAKPKATAETIREELSHYSLSDSKILMFIVAAQTAVRSDAGSKDVYLELLRQTACIPDTVMLACLAKAATSPTATPFSVFNEAKDQLSNDHHPLKPFAIKLESNTPAAIPEIIRVAVSAVRLFGPDHECIASIMKTMNISYDDFAKDCILAAEMALISGASFNDLFVFFESKAYLNSYDLTSGIFAAIAGKGKPPFVPSEEELKTRKSHERWLDTHQRNRPEFWHPAYQPSLEVVCQHLWSYVYPGELNCEVDNISSLIHTLCKEMKQNKITPDFELPFWLFHLKNLANQGDDCNLLIENALKLCMKLMTVQNKGEVVRFAGLIDSEKGTEFRKILYPYLYRWSEWSKEKFETYNLGQNTTGWFSVQEILRRQIEIIDELKKTGPRGLLLSRYENHPHFNMIFNSPGFDEYLLGVCEMHRQYCLDRLARLDNSDEVQLPKYYHGMGSTESDSEVIPTNLLEENGKLLPRLDSLEYAPPYVGVFVSTRITPEYGIRIFAFSSSLEWQEPYKIFNLSYERVKNPTRTEYWFGRMSIPISLEAANGECSPHKTPVTIISPKIIEQRIIKRNTDAEGIPVMGILQALLEQFCIEQITPFLRPKDWPRRATTTKEKYFAKDKPHLKSNLAWTFPKFCFSSWPGGNIDDFYQLFRSSILDPEAAREQIMAGALTTADEPALPITRDEILEIAILNKETMMTAKLNKIAQLFPGSSLPPPLRHIYYKSISGNKFGEQVGHDLGLLSTSLPVLEMLFTKTFDLWNALSQEEKKEFLEGKEKNISDFHLRLAYEMIKEAIPSNDQDTILVPYQSNGKNCLVGINPDTFSVGEKHGRDHREVAVEPSFIRELFGFLTKTEKKLLKSKIYIVDDQKDLKLQNPARSDDKVNHILDLLREMRDGMFQRYFDQVIEMQGLPQRLNNDGLIEIFKNRAKDEILAHTQHLTQPFREEEPYPKVDLGISDALIEVVHFYTKRTKLERSLWVCCGKQRNPITEPMETVLKKCEQTDFFATADNIAYLALAIYHHRESPLQPQLLEQAKKMVLRLTRLEKARLDRLSRQLENSNPEVVCLITELLGERVQHSVREMLTEARKEAEKLLNEVIDEEEVKAYEEWMEHIDERLKKIEQGELIELPAYYDVPRMVDREEGIPLLQTEVPWGETGYFVYPEWIKRFGEQEAGGLSFSSKGLKPFVYHTKSEKGRTLAVAVIGDYSDPYAPIPIMRESVAKLERNFFNLF